MRTTNRRRLLPLLGLCLALAVATAMPAHAQTSASLEINFGRTPRWSSVNGTSVRMLRTSERPDYDMFRYGGRYWAYNNDRWYSSRTLRGSYVWVPDRRVPREFSRVPRRHWQHYPAAWGDRPGNRGNGYGNDRDKGRGRDGDRDRNKDGGHR